MPLPLAGRTVAFAEGRQSDDLARLLEKEGAAPLPCPLLSILDTPDPGPVLGWLDELAGGRFDLVVLLTGEGVRRLVGFAERSGRREAVLAGLARTPAVCRGPKPGRALKEVGLAGAETASPPTTEGVIAALRARDLRGRRVGVQLYAPANPPLTEFLAAAGAEAVPVLPYVYAPQADADRVVDLIGRLARGEVDVLIFTSSPQVDRLFEVAAEHQREAGLQAGLARARVAAVGPIVADNLRRRGVRVDIVPEQGWVMKNLVQHITRALAAPEPAGGS